MNLSIAGLLILYWTLIIAVFGIGIGTDFGNPFFDAGFNTTASVNASGFTAGEIDSGGFFSGVLGVFTAIARFIGLALFGIGLGSILPTWIGYLFNLLFTGITLFTIGFIIDSVWSG